MAGIITDPIGDMLIRIKNANQIKNKYVIIPFSQVRVKILEILKTEGFIGDFTIEKGKSKSHKEINVQLKYNNDQRVIVGVRRISKPGLKVYSSAKELPRVLSGLGTAIISTSKGIMTDRKARELKIGGEIIAYVW